MRDLNELNRWRRVDDWVLKRFGEYGDATAGFFEPVIIATSYGVQQHITFRVIASSGEGWEHVSVSLPHRCPTWEEMEEIRRMFFLDHETVMQLHVPVTDHINCHPYCLHLWRPLLQAIPKPPAWMVGPKK